MEAETGGPPCGGWIVESLDLYNTTVRHGITGESRTLANGSPLLEKSKIVNWKHSHRANLSFSLKLAGPRIGTDEVDLIHRKIMEWVEGRPHEWYSLASFRFAECENVKQQKYTELSIVLCHRESWHSYCAVQDSKSEFLLFLSELENHSR